MERLFFSCPMTGQSIDVGIESDVSTLLRIRMKNVTARCPACGEQHEWPIADARLEKAA
jgi:predicted RNA-binding Zn-ribbon protein involved in translation (DUF1610 family)